MGMDTFSVPVIESSVFREIEPRQLSSFDSKSEIRKPGPLQNMSGHVPTF